MSDAIYYYLCKYYKINPKDQNAKIQLTRDKNKAALGDFYYEYYHIIRNIRNAASHLIQDNTKLKESFDVSIKELPERIRKAQKIINSIY